MLRIFLCEVLVLVYFVLSKDLIRVHCSGKFSWSSKPRGGWLHKESIRLDVIQHICSWERSAVPCLWYLWWGWSCHRLHSPVQLSSLLSLSSLLQQLPLGFSKRCVEDATWEGWCTLKKLYKKLEQVSCIKFNASSSIGIFYKKHGWQNANQKLSGPIMSLYIIVQFWVHDYPYNVAG